MATTDVARPARARVPDRAGTPPETVADERSPEPEEPLRRTARWRPPVAIAAVVAGLLAGQAVAVGLALAAGGDSSGLDGVGLVAADVVMLLIVVAFARRGAERLTAATLAIRRAPFWPSVGWTALFYVAVTGAQALWVVAVAGPGLEPSGGAGDGAPAPMVLALLLVLGVAVTAPIAEELAFRGYLFPALTGWRGPWIAASITALLFGAAHAAVYPPAFLPALAFFGFGACLLVWFTGSLLPSVALHALNNGLAVSAVFEWSWQIPLVAIGATAVSVLILVPFARERVPRAPAAAAA